MTDGAQNFKIFRALGLSFRAWFANILPITLLAAVLYAPVIYLSVRLPGEASDMTQRQLYDAYLIYFERAAWLLASTGALMAPLLTYRLVQWMNGKRASMWTSFRYGVRGIIPAAMIGAATSVLGMIPYGVVIAIIIICIFFVAAPAAVAEKLGPVNALWRGARLTDGRRGGIFVIYLLMTVTVLVVIFTALSPMMEGKHVDLSDRVFELKRAVYILVATVAVFQIITAVIQSVSYSLLRTDKDGISNEELATVFD